MQSDTNFRSRFSQILICHSIYVDLPIEGLQGREVVTTGPIDPGQPIPCVYIPCSSFTERALPVVDACLRDNAELRFTHCRKSHQQWEQMRKE